MRQIESRISSRQSPLERRIDEMLGTLEPGDRLLVSELSRLGRSLSQVIQIVETLVRRKIRFIAIKEAIEFDGKQDLPTKVMIALFGLFAEVERDHITRYNGGLFYERSGPGPSGKTRKETMIRKKWIDGEVVLSVETEDEFWKAVSTGEAVEVTRGVGGEDRFDGRRRWETVAEIDAARYDPSE